MMEKTSYPIDIQEIQQERSRVYANRRQEYKMIETRVEELEDKQRKRQAKTRRHIKYMSWAWAIVFGLFLVFVSCVLDESRARTILLFKRVMNMGLHH